MEEEQKTESSDPVSNITEQKLDNKTDLPKDTTIPIHSLLSSQTKVATAKNKDTLIDIKIGNPLIKITELLEEIKKQKAFSFTLNGSLSIMGVALTLSIRGIFGTTHALCDKGVQTHIGRVKMLQISDGEPDNIITKIKNISNFLSSIFTGPIQTTPRYRYTLQTSDNKTLHLEEDEMYHLPNLKIRQYMRLAYLILVRQI